MTFDVYFPFVTSKGEKAGQKVPGVKPNPKNWSEILELSNTDEVRKLVKSYRETGDTKYKMALPSVNYMGRCNGEYRSAANMTPTQAVMVDIDHVNEAMSSYMMIRADATEDWWRDNMLLVHITPSGKGLRFVFLGQTQFSTVEENINWFSEHFQCSRFGDVDTPCHDFSRISFMFVRDEVLFKNEDMLAMESLPDRGLRQREDAVPVKKKATSDVPEFTDEEKAKFDKYEYRGTPVKAIIEKYVEVKGIPESGEIHNFYNEMIKYFRNIMNNDKRALLYALPRFGHTAEECWSSIVSICRVNTLSTLPREFYFFLKDNGFYLKGNPRGSMADYMLQDGDVNVVDDIPYLPPVFKQLVEVAPKDFRLSVVNSLLPIMGTLASYLKAEYFYDGREHTTSFFSVIYAPAGTGKGFVERYMDLLFQQLIMRDYVQQARDAIFQRELNRKGANDKAPAEPHTSLRIIPAKNSEAEFLQKQKDNCGYHMFTYAAEMDSWAKGVKAAGGNKDDMIRVAWDNGEYGQQFKAASTFKGKVRLYWNVLITGTLQQLLAYFRNVENGLITRCSFTTIENQEFASAPIWKKLSKKSLAVIQRYAERCDRNSYTEPCELLPEDIDMVDDKKFDEEVEWHFKFRPRQTVDMMWLKPTIDEFLNEQLRKASLDFDKARDVFRRRVAVRGFRLGLLCYSLWEKPRQQDLMRCLPFIKWWMEQDLESSLNLWGSRYNEAVEETPNLAQRSLFEQLPNKFDKNDVYSMCMRQGIKTPIRNILYQWRKLGFVRSVSKSEFEKVKNENK